MAIGITLKKAQGNYDLGDSKFFGIPTLPEGWLEELDDELIFVAQIRLSDIAGLDPDHALPHTGYLYFFLESQAHMGEEARAVVRYSPEEPAVAVDNFNEGLDMDDITQDWLITFAQVDDDADGIKLLGEPAGWQYEDAPRLLLQYDPLATEGLNFMNVVDGYGFFFFGEDGDFEAVTWQSDFS